MQFPQLGIFHVAADGKMKSNSSIAYQFCMHILYSEMHYLNQQFLTLHKNSPFLWDKLRSQKKPENAQRNEIAVTFDLCLGLTWFWLG